MALKLNERYPGRFDSPTADYPQGSFKNRTAPGALDGSYLEKDWANDKEGFFQSLIDEAGITPSGAVDKVGASQYYDALKAVIADQVDTPRIDVPSAATVDLVTLAPDTRAIRIAGTTTITGFTVGVGAAYLVTFSGSLTLTNNAAIVTNRGANIAVAAGDSCIVRATADNVVEVICGDFLIDRGMGSGQTWQNLTASRASGVTYTNTTGRTIAISVNTNSGIGRDIAISVNGFVVARTFTNSVDLAQVWLSAIIPAGATYSVTVAGSGATIGTWGELRS